MRSAKAGNPPSARSVRAHRAPFTAMSIMKIVSLLGAPRSVTRELGRPYFSVRSSPYSTPILS